MRRRAQAGGATLLLSSHILSEAEALSDRVSIIRRGRVVETGALAELRHLTRTAITVDVVSAPAGLADVPGVHDVRIEPHGTGARLTCEVDSDALPALVGALAGAGVHGLTSAPPTLEQLFLRHYSDDLAGVR